MLKKNELKDEKTKDALLSVNWHAGDILHVIVQQSKQYGQKCEDKIRLGANRCRTEELPH